MKKSISIGIDATSIVDGGGLTHLKELVENYLKQETNHHLIVYASKNVLKQLLNHPRLSKHNFSFLNKSRIHRIFFQIFLFDKYLKSECDIFFSITGDYIGNFRPFVAMSQNMLLYEREFWKKIKSFKERIKFYLNFKRQSICFKNAGGIIFLSEYAKNYISIQLNITNKDTKIIHHGISSNFITNKIIIKPLEEYSFTKPFKFLYVSTVHVYKNQWTVVEAISKLREKGYPVDLTLIGKIIYKPSGEKLKKTITKLDPNSEFIRHIGNLPHIEMAKQYFNHDGIIFASSCENMPNILLESMASGKPIACSDKNPMPEFLKDGGYYFNSKSSDSIFYTLEKLLLSLNDFTQINKINLSEIEKYSWIKTSKKTIDFIEESFLNHQNYN